MMAAGRPAVAVLLEDDSAASLSRKTSSLDPCKINVFKYCIRVLHAAFRGILHRHHKVDDRTRSDDLHSRLPVEN